MSSPKITVLMPTHNVASYIEEAVESILRQTFADFKLLIIDDASTDDTYPILNDIHDPRIHVVRNKKHLGTAHSLNKGLNLCDTEFIARMDGDGISLPERLALQYDYMSTHAGTDILGAWDSLWSTPRVGVRCYPPTFEDIRIAMLFGTAMSPATIMFRRASLEKKTLQYVPEFNHVPDLDLLIRATHALTLENLPALVCLTRPPSQTKSSMNRNEWEMQTMLLIARQLQGMGISLSKEELALQSSVVLGTHPTCLNDLDAAKTWLKRLAKEAQGLPKENVEREIAKWWYKFCLNATPLGPRILPQYYSFPMRKTYKTSKKEMYRLYADAFRHLFPA